MRQSPIHHRRVASLAAAVLLSTVSAFGQTGQLTMTPPAKDQAAQTVRRLTVDEAVKLAIDQNLGVQIQRIDPQIQDESVAQARAAWLPNLTSSFSKNSNNQQNTNSLAGSGSTITSGLFSGGAGVNEVLPWGGSYTATWGNSRSTTTNLSNTFNPVINSNLSFNYTQPLLRNFSIDGIRQNVAITKKVRSNSDVTLHAAIVQTSRNVKNAYWDLVYQIDNLKAAQESLRLAQQSLQDNTRRVEIGTMAPIDIVDAKVEVARNEEAVILAQEAIDQAQDTLRMLIFDPKTPDFWAMKIEPTDTVPFQAQKIDTEGAVRNALDKRTDLRSARITMQESDINIRFFRNQILPDVNVQTNYQASAVAGVQLESVNIFDPAALAARQILAERSYSAALGDVFRGAYPFWSFGVQVNYPLGTSAAKANLERAKLQYQQSQTQLRNIEMQVTAQVRNVARQVEANQKRVESARASRELAEQKLAAEEKKFAAGIRETFFVFQAQRDLSTARTAEVRAIADYNKSLVDFEAVQEVAVGGGSGSVTTAGAGSQGGGQGGGS
jgi:outer membrane protein TolC